MVTSYHRYCMVEYVPSSDNPDASAPALPDGFGFLLLAGPDHRRWGVLACEASIEWSDRVRPVPEDVERKLDSAMRFPPALALARNDMDERRSNVIVEGQAFLDRYVARLAHHLEHQSSVPYVLAECVMDQRGYLRRGEYYWVLHYRPAEGTVDWVSDDYHVYFDRVAYFRLTIEQLQRLALS